MTTELVLKAKELSLDDLPFLKTLGHIENDMIILDHSFKGCRLKTPVIVPVDRILAVGQKGLIEFIVSSLISQRPRLIPWVLENSSLIQLARYLLRSCSGSLLGFYAYANTVHQYADRLNSEPDLIIADVLSTNGQPDSARVKKHKGILVECLAELQDQGRSSGRIHSYAKHVRTFYRVNEIELPRPDLPGQTIASNDRAPKPDELQRLLNVADLREKLVISCLALGGFREGTLTKLQCRHVKDDLETGIIPVHVHVETTTTKGKYGEYDTFLAEEAVEYLRLYLEARRQGDIHPGIKAEEIHDGSPLIRDAMYEVPRSIGEKQLYKIVHSLYSKAGLLRKNQNGRYDLRVHSIRKFFKTQLMAARVQGDYVDYFMGHTVDVYHDVQSKGIEFLRVIYMNASLRIQPKSSSTPSQEASDLALKRQPSY